MAKETPFYKILIANRGEVALRIMRSARKLGYRVVAVYSQTDANARHVREADEALLIGPPAPAQSYLRIDALIDAAKRSRADAVHPGYGFLAENADFARACRDADLVFIGPAPEAIAAMGYKAEAKRRMRAAGMPCIPGYDGEEQSDARLRVEAVKLGYPLMIKAAAGGGGRGLRIVHTAEEFADRLRGARAEAQSAFGDSAIILERIIPSARHIEIQVLADRHGNVVHLGERDCSVQRRHQKLIEEAPSPAVTPALRDRMGAATVAAAKAIAYEGAGTFEFLLDPAGNFYFMEMNTRLQVEHAVTEAITGLDLVELQLRIARGEALPFEQEDIVPTGHAIEARLCAEDPARSFLPQSGVVVTWDTPKELRVEHALENGTAVSPHYDSMIAKLVAHGATREDARRSLIAGLAETVALGVPTNQVFLARCLENQIFAAGEATTTFVDHQLKELLARDHENDEPAAATAAALLYATARGSDGVHRLAPTFPIPMRFRLNERDFDATVAYDRAGRVRIVLSENVHDIEIIAFEPNAVRFRADGVITRVAFYRAGEMLFFHYAGGARRVEDRTVAPAARSAESGGDGKLRSATTGRVVAVWVAPGDEVHAGQPVLTLEAMKMEHIHCASVTGRVTAIHVAVGDQVSAGRLLADIAPGQGEERRSL